MVEQLGLAIMFVSLYLDISSGLTSGTTKGMLSTYLNSDVLSITMQSSLAALVAYSFEIDPPALKKAISIFVKLNSSSASTVISSSPNFALEPLDF